MVVLSDIRSTIYMAISIIPNTETLPMVLEGLEQGLGFSFLLRISLENNNP